MSSEPDRAIRGAGKTKEGGSGSKRSSHGSGRAGWSVEIALPHPLPVKSAELDVLERYFNDLIDVAFKSKRQYENN